MTKPQLARLKAILSKLEDAKDKLEILKEEVEQHRDEKQDAYDSKSEKWQEGEKGCEAYDYIQAVDDRLTVLEDGFNELDSASMTLGGIETE